MLTKAAILGLEAGEGTGKRKVRGGPLWSIGAAFLGRMKMQAYLRPSRLDRCHWVQSDARPGVELLLP